MLAEEERDGLGVVAAEGDEGVELVGLQHLDALLDSAFDFADVGARGAEEVPP